ncbi:unnamed protein product [Arctogadus glacialis]
MDRLQHQHHHLHHQLMWEAPPPPSQSSQPGATKRRRTTEVAPDPVDAALLEKLQELRREERDSKNVFSTFTAYLNTVLQDLPATNGKKLMKESQQLMLNYL